MARRKVEEEVSAGEADWSQKEGEPDLWFRRFDTYRSMGVRRSLQGCYELRAKEDEAGHLNARRPGHAWNENMAKWFWVRRARAYDDFVMAQDHEAEEFQRQEARNHRLETLAELKAGVYKDLQTAGIGELDEEEAKKFLPQLRMFYFALINAERLEYGEATEIVDGESRARVSEDLERMIAKVYGNPEAGSE